MNLSPEPLGDRPESVSLYVCMRKMNAPISRREEPQSPTIYNQWLTFIFKRQTEKEFPDMTVSVWLIKQVFREASMLRSPFCPWAMHRTPPNGLKPGHKHAAQQWTSSSVSPRRHWAQGRTQHPNGSQRILLPLIMLDRRPLGLGALCGISRIWDHPCSLLLQEAGKVAPLLICGTNSFWLCL